MKRIAQSFLGLAFLLGLVSAPSAAVLFSNFPDPHYGGNYLELPSGGSQEFTLGSASTLSAMDISTWTNGAGVPGTIYWSISTGAHETGIILATGASSATNVYTGNYGGYYNIYTTTFGLPSVNLGAGDYFVTLHSNATASDMYWGVTNLFTGHESYTTYDGSYWYNTTASYENLLVVHGSEGGSVPEPFTVALMGIGLAAFAFARYRSA